MQSTRYVSRSSMRALAGSTCAAGLPPLVRRMWRRTSWSRHGKRALMVPRSPAIASPAPNPRRAWYTGPQTCTWRPEVVSHVW